MERFEMKTSEDLQKIRDTKIDSNISENTLKNTNWALATWNKWAEWRNKAQTDDMPEVPMGEELQDLSDESLSTFLSLYVCEVKRENGTYYTPDTLYNLVCGLNRYLKLKKGRPDINFFEDRGPFAEFKRTMDGQIINLSRQDSCSLNRRITENVTEEQEAILWDKSIFSLTTAQGLSYAAFHYISKDFGLKGRDRHRELRVENFSFGEDRIGKFVEFIGSSAPAEVSTVTPTSKFGLINKARGKTFRKPKNTKCYQDQLNPISLYTILETYLAHVPTQGCFYRKPLPPSAFEQVRFADVPIGKNTLGEYTKTFMCQAGFEGNYTSQTSDGATPKEPSVLAKKMLDILQDDDRELMQFSYSDSPSADNYDPENSVGEVMKIKQEVMDGDDGASNDEAEASDNEDNVAEYNTQSTEASPSQPFPIGIGQPFSIAPDSDKSSTTLPISRVNTIANTYYRKIESKDKMNSNLTNIAKPIILSPIPTTLTSSAAKGLVNNDMINRKRKLDAVYADIQMNQAPTVLSSAIGIPVTLFQAGTSTTLPKTIISNVNSQTNGIQIQKDYGQKVITEPSNLTLDKELKELKRQKYTLEIEHFKRLASSEKETLEMKKLEKVKMSLEIDKLRLEKEKLELEVNSMRCAQATNL